MKHPFKSISILVVLFLIIAGNSAAQSFTIELDVEPRVETTVNRSLDFGQIVAGTGFQQIPLGSPTMGVFQIRTLNAQNLIISLDPSSELVHQELGRMASIPLNLQVNYTQNGVDDYRQSVPLTGFERYITLDPPPQNPQSAWTSVFLYVYGSIELGMVPSGVYTGEVVLSVVYE
ncbi:DUF4402 domain-containing protein [Rhodohalobacter mucosus]|uniref:Spore coat protein U domain-containing protein n=1 Tax=Rhodohalobacter mucosus TaxID=2079485 RepID=A0A316TWL9_9BACT|nr:DUF4402 domain-containing protein [Rhodohalobacter mucosus]PWN06944.1 hypothetical protein DDZ15_06630 [Rhodohalobacter mucosus]